MRATIRLAASLVVLSGLALTLPKAYGQAQIPPDLPASTDASARVYTPAYFNAYVPLNALDMVARVPGFEISGGNNNGRGLGQGGANVLINGKRLSGKSVGPHTALRRIPADSVVSITIREGADLGIPGLTGDVADIRVNTTGLSGNWRWRPRFRQDAQPRWLRGNATVSGKWRDIDYTLTVEDNSDNSTGFGPERVRDADGVIYETAEEKGGREVQAPKISAALVFAPREGHSANLSAEYQQVNFHFVETSDRTALTPRGSTYTSIFRRGEDEWNAEISADYAFPLGIGDLKLIGVQRLEHSPVGNEIVYFDDQGFALGERFNQVADEGESIGRAEYSWAGTQAGQDWQISAEGAYNFLDIESDYFTADRSALFTEEVLDDPLAKVEENRGEITLTHNRTFGKKLTVQASIGVEYSEITQSGANNVSRSFVRPKGFINTAYAASDTLDIRYELGRRVGQLNFFDFISSVSLETDIDQAGNARLVPVQFWNHALEFEKDFGQGTNLNLRLFYEDIEDIVDNIPIGTDGEGVGNIDTASAYGAILRGTLKGERWNFDGTELNFTLVAQSSELLDPLLTSKRRINGRDSRKAEVNFRHDIPDTNIAYGFGLNYQRSVPRRGIFQIVNNSYDDPFSAVFIEHKDVAGLKIRGTFRNLGGFTERLRRDVFDGQRNVGNLDYIEERERYFRNDFEVSISGTF
ncbi:TonB-dependent receptor [Robiginitomaculum antarcticum]|uniref:hypothetical protein n=1 Tax=Robiginitomaculum antarcticum TaxID=437507 RepID=UPI0003665E79|nr:hypothetical protein [Robiginitomaculum antarcticum]